MIINKKYYTADNAILRVGIDKWLKYEDNLITVKKKLFIHNLILKNFVKIFCNKKLSKEKYFLGLANVKLAYFLSDFIIKIYIKKKLNKIGIRKAVYNGKELELFEFFNNKELINKKYRVEKDNFFINSLKKLRLYFEIFYKKIKLKKNLIVFNIGQRNKHSKTYCNLNNAIEVYFDRFIYSKDYQNIDIKKKNYVSIKVNKFFNILKKEINFIDKKDIDNLSYITKDKLLNSLKFILSTTNQLNGLNFFFISTSSGGPINRSFLAACRIAKLKTIGFFHGNPYLSMFENSQTRFFNDSFSITDEVLINSEAELDGIKQMIKPYKKIIQKPKIILPQVSSYLETFNNLREQKSPIKCKKIMLVGMPHSLQKTYHFEDTSVLDSYEQLRLEIRIIKALKNKNFDILYKIHPGTLNEYKKIFQKLSVTIINEKFESSYNLADCIIFPYTGTTTFGYTLMSNIPIVVFNRHQNLYKKKKKLFLSLKKRCSVIDTNINKYGKITFNEKKFIMGINKSLYLKSHEIVRKFAIGQT